MKVVGVEGSRHAVTWEASLPHGADPRVLAWDCGSVVVRPLDAIRDTDGELVLRLAVRMIENDPRPKERSRGRDVDLVVNAEVAPEIRQRCAAYAVVRSSRGLLATQYSDRTGVPGRWGMPGGGIDEDENPIDAVLREVMEETSQEIQLGELVAVQSSHWIGRSPRSTIEDFHAVRLIYVATCATPSEPVVLDHGGTTAAARWVPVSDWESIDWTVNWYDLIKQRLTEAEVVAPAVRST